MTTYSSILQAALKLSLQERSELAEALLETVDEEQTQQPPQLSAAWREEIARRSAAYDRGEIQGIPWDQVREEIQRKYQDHA